MGVNRTLEERLEEKYGADGAIIAKLGQECIDEGNTSEKDIKKCLKKKLKELEDLSDDTIDGGAQILGWWVTVG